MACSSLCLFQALGCWGRAKASERKTEGRLGRTKLPTVEMSKEQARLVLRKLKVRDVSDNLCIGVEGKNAFKSVPSNLCSWTRRFGLSPSSIGWFEPTDEGLSPKRLVHENKFDGTLLKAFLPSTPLLKQCHASYEFLSRVMLCNCY